MAYALVILYLILVFLRPAELYPTLGPLQIMGWGLSTCTLATVVAILTGRSPNLRVPQPYLAVAFYFWCIAAAILGTRWLGAYLVPVGVLTPNLALCLLLFLNFDSARRVRIACTVLAALALVIALQAVYSYHTLWRAQTFLMLTTADDLDQDISSDSPDWLSEALLQSDPRLGDVESAEAGDSEQGPDSEAGKPALIIRLRGLGFLHDPNDFAQALVSMLPLVLVLRRPSGRVRNLLGVWLPVGAILYAVSLTRSRGAIIALAALFFVALQARLGRTASLVIGVLGGVAAVGLGFAGGRTLSMDESAEGRLEAWAAGLEMLKESPIWGVGQGQFTEHHGLVAHNSFVHCFSETGFVGYTVWLSMIGLTLYGLYRVETSETPEGEEDLRPFARALRLGFTAFLVGAFFLSRSYGAMLFLQIGLGTGVCAVAHRRGTLCVVPSVLRWLPAAATCAVTSVIGIWLLMKVLGSAP